MNIKIVLPVYNDWEALKLVLSKIQSLYKNQFNNIEYIVVNDNSSIEYQKDDFNEFNIKVIHLNCNLSHQRAIAIGLAYLANEEIKTDYVIVMDSDGEDQPEHIEKLINQAKAAPGTIVFAQRKKRSESLIFKVFYMVYKFIFKSLTGYIINFGNFSIIPGQKLKKLSFVSEIWNNYPGGVIRSKLPISAVSLDRGTRLAGKSKMNFSSLILHGMSAISVFLDFTAVRILIGICIMVAFAILGSAIVLYLKFGLNQATPGWATMALGALFIIALQGFFISLFILFMVLSSRRYTSFIPYLGYKTYIDHVE